MKNNCIINSGFDLIIIWESDYKNDKETVLKNIVLYILNTKEEYERNNKL